MEFIPSLSVISAFVAAGLVLNLTPGPDMTLYLGRALAEGRRAGLITLSGTVTGVIVHTGLAAFGLSALLAASPTAFLAVKIAGALYLLWLAWQALRKGSMLKLSNNMQQKHSDFANWLAGVSINLLNPKVALFFITFLPQFVSVSDPHATGKMIFLGGLFFSFAIPISIATILAVDRFSRAMANNKKVLRMIDWLFAGVFSTFAVKILLIRSTAAGG